MTIKEFGLKRGNHFIAMEYYGLILNRVFLVLITEDNLVGLKVRGIIGSRATGSPIASLITELVAVTNNLNNPYSYVNDKYFNKFDGLNINEEEILELSTANFKIEKSQIIESKYDPSKKWGMGEYPHDGKVRIKLVDGKRKEFIIMANQSGKNIAKWIKNDI